MKPIIEELKKCDHLILAVDDDLDNLTLVSRTLTHEGYVVRTASGGHQAVELLKTSVPELVLLDVNMPGMSGLEVLQRIRAKNPHVSVIIVSARSETEDIIRGLDMGADDYICKPFEPLELLARVRAQLRIKDLTQKLAAANERLRELVDIDDLTGLYNMRSIYQKLELEITRAKRHRRAVAVVMMDMDDFKKVNDNHDHLFGSFVLSEVGKIVRANIRGVDFGARYGGDEFMITLSETTLEGAELFADRLRQSIASYVFAKDNDRIHLTVSMGVAVVIPADHAIDARSLVRSADRALYDAKREGKNCVRAVEIASNRGGSIVTDKPLKKTS